LYIIVYEAVAEKVVIALKLDNAVINSLSVIKTNTDPRVYNVDSRRYHSLSFRVEGENVIYDKNGVEITSNARSLTFVPAGIPYTHHVLTPSQQIVVHFTTLESIGDIIENFILPLRCEIEYLFFSLYNQYESEQREKSLQCISMFYNILALIAKNLNRENSYKDDLIRDSVAYMHEHYRESDFNIDKLLKQTYISPAYYRRIFKEIYQCSPIEYLKNLRINYAKQLLENGYYTVSEVAELSGFSTPTYFSYEFKKMTGYSPTQYRFQKS
jgi:AraC-like DNA-binding protein